MHILAMFPFPCSQQSDRKSGMSFLWRLISMVAAKRVESRDAASNRRRIIEIRRLRKVERALALLNSSVEPGAQDIDVAVIGHLEVVDASHDGREEIVRGVGSLGGLADNSEHGRKRFETCKKIGQCLLWRMEDDMETYHRWATWGYP